MQVPSLLGMLPFLNRVLFLQAKAFVCTGNVVLSALVTNNRDSLEQIHDVLRGRSVPFIVNGHHYDRDGSDGLDGMRAIAREGGTG